MSLRQRTQRPSESSNQSGGISDAQPPHFQHRQTSENNIHHHNNNNNNAPPPPPPLRSPSVPLVSSSPMFHNQNYTHRGSFGGYGTSPRPSSVSNFHTTSTPHSSNSIHSAASTPAASSYNRYPRNASYSNSPGYTTAPPVATNTSFGRSHTEPFYQGDAVTNSNSSNHNMPPSPPAAAPTRNYSYGGGQNNISGSSMRSHGSGMSSLGSYDSHQGYYNPNASAPASSVVAPDSRGYGGYHSNSIHNTTSTSNTIPINTSNPYKISKKPSKSICTRFLSSILYLSILLLSSTTTYLRHVVKSTNIELETAHQNAHRRHLSHVKKTGGRHTTNVNAAQETTFANQRGEITSLSDSNNNLQQQIDTKIDEYKQLEIQYQSIHGKYNGLESTKQNILKLIQHETNIMENIKQEKEEMEALLESKEKLDQVMGVREEALWKRVERLSAVIGGESEREALDWFAKDYGHGPYKIEMELSYPHVLPEDHPNPHSWERVSKWIVIELAPLSIMPHAVNMFLRQVHHKMWQGIPMVHKDETKIQFGPQRSGEERQFGTNFSKLLYQEYSPQYKHEQWTIGYAGRPAGPDFYINTKDNTDIHGPGPDKHSEADPCFGRVVEGFDVLERIGMIPRYDGEEEALAGLYEVKILHAFLIKPRDGELNQQEEEEEQVVEQ